jgi:hypothetical protein
VVTERAPALPPVPTRLTVTPSLATMGGPTLMPDVSGLSARDATRVLSGLGLSVRASGSGFVADQFPRAGSPIDPGTLGTLVLARRASWTPERGAR